MARAVGAVLMLAFQVLVARRVDADAAGRFYLVFVVTAVLAVVGRYGVDQLLLRAVATAEGTANRSVATTYRAGVLLAAGLLTLAGLLLVALASTIADVVFRDGSLAAPLRIAAMGVLPFGLVAVQGEAIKGLGRAGLGAAVQSVVAPVASITLLVLVPGIESVTALTVVYVTGLALSSVAAHGAWRRLTASSPGATPLRTGNLVGLARTCTPFFWTSASGLALAWGAVLALGVTGRTADVAAYFAADRWTAIASMVLVAVNGAVGPHFARLWAARDHTGIVALLRATTAGSAAVAVALFAMTVVLAQPLLGVFGDGFDRAVTPLRILAVGQLVVLAGGPVTTLLVMMGRERAQARAGALACGVLGVLLIALVPSLGATGAATAATGALIVNKCSIAGVVLWTLKKEAEDGVLPGRVLARHDHPG